ncbi:uncharacterized protein LOC132602054 [Lycium barbarum]|uniref:uncharacterized protein LOC132602054 n=1 Tax=Lycium barbarum TaxID=112863 RepID=UPI00293E21F7|nr:uncharacterized protein LOC132602054 [Lycium barbarum]
MRDIPVENGSKESRKTPHGVGALQTLESESQGSGASLLEEITPAEPFSVAECYAICSDRSSKPTPLPKTEMRAPVAIIVENGKESRSTWYDLGEKVSKVDGAVRVTHLNDQRGTRRQVNITSHTGNAPAASCSKGLLYTSIEDAGDRTAIRKLRDTCNQNGVSLAVVLDKSSVLANDRQIVSCFGFSDSHCADMIFRSFREDGSPVDVKGSCLLMWKREELCVDVWDVWCGNTELLSQYVAFSVSWVVG